MNKENALREARAEALKNRVDMVVVNDPLANAEESSGPYGYCPRAGVDVLFARRIKCDDYFIEADGFSYSAADLEAWKLVASLSPEKVAAKFEKEDK